ncbi:hypothetical protein OZX72_00635 [Bifidobacterium sp. ESL0769]|nr:hypothetical protein [Bifidobacterium sp. ESL0769]WEV67547.1 hypothetical protein OZX72_00635 [Bifidobacterium sp. ESL0769]
MKNEKAIPRHLAGGVRPVISEAAECDGKAVNMTKTAGSIETPA